MSAFKKAVKEQAKLRMALAGPAGSGKTYSALTIAQYLADGGKVAVIDTERGSASKYADEFDFDVLELTNFHPANYVEAVQEAVKAGYTVVVVDSLSHAWYGTGGLLEIVGGNFGNWKNVKPIENKLLDTLTGAPIHVIVTMRSKAEYVVEKNEHGKATPQKVGTAPIQRDGIEYEFDVYGELDLQNTFSVRKSRCKALNGAVIARPGKALADTLSTWLGNGAEPQQPVGGVVTGPVDLGPDAPVSERETVTPIGESAPNWATLQMQAQAVHMCRGKDEFRRIVVNLTGRDVPAERYSEDERARVYAAIQSRQTPASLETLPVGEKGQGA